MATDWADERATNAKVRHWLERERLPVPRWWPAGVGYEPMQGAPDTG